MSNPLWRIHIDFEQLVDEDYEDLLAIFEMIEQFVTPRIDPHEDGEDCLRFWAMGMYDVSDEYEDVDLDNLDVDEEGTVWFSPHRENPGQWN